MKQNVTLKSGKILRFPARMFKPHDLADMQVPFVENQIFFNKAGHNETFPAIDAEKKNNMAVLNYPDCSGITFSSSKLAEVVGRQYEASGDFIILPYFKDETEYDLNTKIMLAQKLKGTTNKEIIIEVSYKIDGGAREKLKASSDAFDYLAIFYGVHFGRYPSFQKINEEILIFKRLTGKRVLCIAVPYVFAGDSKANESHLMPIWDLISDGWVKNWKAGGSKTETRLIDYADLKNKNLVGWLKIHSSGELVKHVNVSIFSLFQDARAMELYTKMLIDEILNEVSSLTPANIEEYLIKKVPPIYRITIAINYIEKIIQMRIRHAEWARLYTPDEIQLLERCLHQSFSPKALDKEISSIESLATSERKIPVESMIAIVNKIRSG